MRRLLLIVALLASPPPGAGESDAPLFPFAPVQHEE